MLDRFLLPPEMSCMWYPRRPAFHERVLKDIIWWGQLLFIEWPSVRARHLRPVARISQGGGSYSGGKVHLKHKGGFIWGNMDLCTIPYGTFGPRGGGGSRSQKQHAATAAYLRYLLNPLQRPGLWQPYQ